MTVWKQGSTARSTRINSKRKGSSASSMPACASTTRSTPECSAPPRRHDVLETLEALPRRLYRFDLPPRRIDGVLLQFELGDVTRTIREDVFRRHPDEKLCSRRIGNCGVVEQNLRRAIDPQSARLFADADEEKSD